MAIHRNVNEIVLPFNCLLHSSHPTYFGVLEMCHLSPVKLVPSPFRTFAPAPSASKPGPNVTSSRKLSGIIASGSNNGLSSQHLVHSKVKCCICFSRQETCFHIYSCHPRVQSRSSTQDSLNVCSFE